MIAEAAYFRAERNGFAGSDPLRDWCEAEADVDERLRQLEDEHLVGRLEEGLATASKKLATLRRKMNGLTAEARAEWQQDAERLATLRKQLESKLEELREQGENAGLALRPQADKVRAEIAELAHRVSARVRH
jgi:chromosome segregation ATPase